MKLGSGGYDLVPINLLISHFTYETTEADSELLESTHHMFLNLVMH